MMGEYDDMLTNQEDHTPRGVARLKAENERLHKQYETKMTALKKFLETLISYDEKDTAIFRTDTVLTPFAKKARELIEMIDQ